MNISRYMTIIACVSVLFGCASGFSQENTYLVSAKNLIERPIFYNGKRIIVHGFLVSITGVEILSVDEKKCYGQGSGRSYVTTNLPYSVLGPQVGSRRKYEGMEVVVRGKFINSMRPWAKNDIVEVPEEYSSVGPIKNSKIVDFGILKCQM